MKLLNSIIGVFLFIQMQAQSLIPDLTNKKLWETINREADSGTENGYKTIKISEAPSSGFYIYKGFKFSEGEIEFDVKGRDVFQQSFVGIAFHILSDSVYDAVYFRPFNFRNSDTSKRYRAVQYMSVPKFDWPYLRDHSPGQYENKIDPAPNPKDWFHAKIVIKNNSIIVYVNHAKHPCLKTKKLTPIENGKFGLWVGNGSDGNFANLRIKKFK